MGIIMYMRITLFILQCFLSPCLEVLTCSVFGVTGLNQLGIARALKSGNFGPQSKYLSS